MAGFLFKLETRDGSPADPPTLSAAVPSWSPGDAIALGACRCRWLSESEDDDADAPAVLIVEECDWSEPTGGLSSSKPRRRGPFLSARGAGFSH